MKKEKNLALIYLYIADIAVSLYKTLLPREINKHAV